MFANAATPVFFFIKIYPCSKELKVCLDPNRFGG